MRHRGTMSVAVCLASVLILSLASNPVLAQEDKIEALRRENEALRKEMEALRQELIEPSGDKAEVSTGFVASTSRRSVGVSASPEGPLTASTATAARTATIRQTKEGTYVYTITTTPEGTTKVVTVGPDETRALAGDNLSRILKGGVELKKWQIEQATLSHGDAGLETMLRFEKVKLCRKAGKLDQAVEELERIIDKNVSEVTTHAARLTLIEILLEQKKKSQAIIEFEKILETAKDAGAKRDALYGIINLSPDDPESKIETIDRLLEKLKENPIEEGSTPETE